MGRPMNFGDKVNITAKYNRRNQRSPWKTVTCERQGCVFLGYRTIRLKVMGRAAPVDKFIHVALVAVDHLTNPVYVPVYAMVKP